MSSDSGPANDAPARRSARSKARKHALDVLFAAEMRGADPLRLLDEKEARVETPLNPYARTLVEGVLAHRDRIDELLETYATGWTLDRMPAVDRNVLRIGTYELLWGGDEQGEMPEPVAVSEAVALVRELSTDDSPNFVNGLLGRLQSLKAEILAAEAQPPTAALGVAEDDRAH